MKKYQFQLISSLIYVIFTVSTLTGQSCSELVEHINSQVQGIIAETSTSNAIYSSYSSTGNSTWTTQNWTEQVDFSGVAFDKNQTFTLISPRHVLMATHYQRSVGSTVAFHDSNGDIHTATLIAKQSVPGGLNPDITVGLLDVDVPVKYYKVLPPQTDWITFLDSALVVSTHHNRNASLREVRSTYGLFIGFRQSSIVPTSYYAPAVSGNSGNPSFLLINGEPILIETFTYGGWGSGPFFSEPSSFNAINSIMTSLGGGYQLDTIEMCERPVCPPDSTFNSLDLAISEACINENFIALNGGSPVGGSYSGTGVFGNTFYTRNAGVGNHLITYTYTNSEKCIVSDTATFTVHYSSTVSLNLPLSEICKEETNITLNGGIPSGGSYSGIGVSGNTFNPASAGVGNHQITYTYTYSGTGSCINTATATATITVYDLQDVSLDLDISEACINETNILLSGGIPTGGSYSGTGVNGNTFNPASAGVGNHFITYTGSGSGTGSCMNTATATFIVHDLPAVSLDLAVSEACKDETNILLSGGIPAGGSYSGTGVNGKIFNPSIAGVGSHPITYTYRSTGAGNCINSTTTTFIVYDLLDVSLDLAVSEACITETNIALSGGSPTGGSYSGTGVSGNVFNPMVAGVGSHSIIYTYTGTGSGAGSCMNSDTATFIVHDLPAVSLDLAVSEACINEMNIALSGGSPTGGSYSGTGVSSNVFNPMVAGVGNHPITYTYTSTGSGSGTGNCINTATATFIVHDLPAISLDLAVSEACKDETNILLSGGIPAGGSYSGTGVSGKIFNPSIAGVGSHPITYTYRSTGAGNCINSTTTTFIVHDLPDVSLDLAVSEACVTETSVELSGGSPAGGSYSGTGVSGNTFNPMVAGVGYHLITYTGSGSGVGSCMNIDTATFIVHDLPDVSLDLVVSEACVTETNILLSGGSPAGGSYSGVGVSGNTFNPVFAGVGNHPIIYTYTGSGSGVGSCMNIDTATFMVHDLPDVSLDLAVSEACINETNILLSGGSPVGGSYSGTGVSGNTFNPMSAGVGNHPITYEFTDANGCINSATSTFTVHDLPVVSLDLVVTEFCKEETTVVVLNGGSPTGGSYSGAGVNGNIFNPTNAGPGEHLITYEFTDTNGCRNSATAIFTVHDLPIVSLDLAVSEACKTETNIALSGGSPAGGSYSGTGVSGNTFNPMSAGVGNHPITYEFTDTYGCRNSATTTFTVHDLPAVSLDLVVSEACVTETNIVLSGGSPTGGSYSGTGVSSNTFNPMSSGVGNHPITYEFTDANGCINSATAIFIVHDLPTVSLDLAESEACKTETNIALSGGNPAGGSYYGTGVNGNIFNPTIAGVGNHPITYEFTDANGCMNSVTATFTVHDLPVVSLDLVVAEFCKEETTVVVLNGGSPAGGSYSGTGVNGNIFNPTNAGPGEHLITYEFTDANGCRNSATATFIVHDLPVVSLDLVIAEACKEETNIALSGGSPAGGSYSGTGVSGNTFNPMSAGVGNHPITYEFTDANGCMNSATATFTVHDLPIVSLDLVIAEACKEETNIALSGGSPAGGSYSGTGVSGNTFNPMSAGVGNHPITYEFTDANGCMNSATATFTVHDLPEVSLNLAVSEACKNETNIALSGGTLAGGSYSGTGVSGNTFNPMSAGVGNHPITYEFTDANGCMNSATATFTVHDFLNTNLENIEINTNPIPNDTFVAMKEIISNGTIVNNTEVHFHAGESIILLPNFTVNEGAEFTAKIITSCTSSLPILPAIPITNQAKSLEDKEVIIEPTLTISPNPFSYQSKIEINLPKKDIVNITVFDQTGRKIKILAENKLLESGKHIFQLKEEQWPGGMLFINMTTTKTKLVKKAILIK